MSLSSGPAAALRLARTNGKCLAASAFAMCVFAMVALYGQLNGSEPYVALRSRSAHLLDGSYEGDRRHPGELPSLRQLRDKQEQRQKAEQRRDGDDSAFLLSGGSAPAGATAEPSAQQQQSARAPLAAHGGVNVEQLPTAGSKPFRHRLLEVGLDPAAGGEAAAAAKALTKVGGIGGLDRGEAAERLRRRIGGLGAGAALQQTAPARPEQQHRQQQQSLEGLEAASDMPPSGGEHRVVDSQEQGSAGRPQHRGAGGSRLRIGPGAAVDPPAIADRLPVASELLRTPGENDDGLVSPAAAANDSRSRLLLLQGVVEARAASSDPAASRSQAAAAAAVPVDGRSSTVASPDEIAQAVEPRRVDVHPVGGMLPDSSASGNWSVNSFGQWMQANNAGFGRRADSYGSGSYGRGTTSSPAPIKQWQSYDYESAVGALDIHVEHAPDVMTASLGEPWPMPQHYLTSHAWHVVDIAEFQFVAASSDDSAGSDPPRPFSEVPWCGRLRRAVDRYTKLVRETVGGAPAAARPSSSPRPHNVLVISMLTACSDDDMPHERMEESYYLRIDAHGMQLTAVELWGVLRGIETFSQLLYVRDSAVVVNETVIRDYPSYGYRGVMLDTARHYLPVSYIKKSLDAMSYNKFNVFHWHIVDDNSFPYESKKFPDLSKKGAYSSSQIYSVADVREIIAYAADRGIRVVPEFDTPGHTRSWGNAFPALLTNCSADYDPFGAVNPIQQFTYDFFSEFFAEAKSIFPDSYMHIGGDEINYKCWLAVKEIRQFMVEHNMTISEFQYNGGVVERLNGKHLQGYYTKRLLEIMPPNTKKIAWDEAFLAAVQHNLSRSDLVIHVWQQGDMWQQLASQILNEGFSVIVSACWYLNYISYGIDWHKYYDCDLKSFEKYYNIVPEKKSGMLGGSVCLWSEHIDENNLEPILWPRAIAPAEKLWSSELLVSPTAAQGRFEQQHCRLLRRGIRAAPGNGPGSCLGSMKVGPPL